MRKLIYLCCFLAASSSVIFWSCQKDIQSNIISPAELVATGKVPKSLIATGRDFNPFTDNRVRVENGMLVFDDYKAFVDIHEGLKAMYSNASLNHSALIEMGHNPDSDIDAELLAIPANPVLRAFASKFSLVTEEVTEDLRYKAHLQAGNEDEEYVGSCIFDPTIQAMLNDKREVGIGDFIVKFIDLHKIALIYNKNLEVLESVRNTPVEMLKDGFDLNMLDIGDAVVGANDIFKENSDGSRTLTGGECEIKFEAVQLSSSNTFTFTNLSKVPKSLECGIKEKAYLWAFGDGTTAESYGGDINHTFGENGYPYTVTLTAICGACKNQSFTFVIKQPVIDPCGLMDFVDFTATNTNIGNRANFQVSGLKSGMTATLNFGDSKTLVIVGGQASSSAIKFHDYASTSDPTVYTVTLTITMANCPNTVVVAKEITLSCGYFYSKKKGVRNRAINGDTWTLTGVIWLQDNPFFHEVGSSSCVRRNSIVKRANILNVDLEGTINKTTYPSDSPSICTDVTISPDLQEHNNDSYIVRQPALMNNIKFRDNELFSKHKAIIGTGSSAVPIEIPQLFLVN
jgi:PKD repeat protein